MKTCSTCKESKAFAAFHRKAGSADGYRSECAACASAKARAKYHEDEEYRTKVREQQSQKYADPTFREQARLRKERYRRLSGAPEVPRRSSTVRAKLCDSHVNEWRRLAAQRHEMALVEFRSLPYAHVDDYRKEVDRRHWHEFDKHRPETRTNRIARRRFHRENLTDHYIVQMLTSGDSNALKKADIPQTLIEVKRAQMQLKRLLSDMKKGHDHEER